MSGVKLSLAQAMTPCHKGNKGIIMTPAEITAARATLGLDRQGLADALGVTLRTVYRWEAGSARITPQTARLLRQMVAAHG